MVRRPLVFARIRLPLFTVPRPSPAPAVCPATPAPAEHSTQTPRPLSQSPIASFLSEATSTSKPYMPLPATSQDVALDLDLRLCNQARGAPPSPERHRHTRLCTYTRRLSPPWPKPHKARIAPCSSGRGATPCGLHLLYASISYCSSSVVCYQFPLARMISYRSSPGLVFLLSPSRVFFRLTSCI